MKDNFNITRFFRLYQMEFSEKLPIIVKLSAVCALILAINWIEILLFGWKAPELPLLRTTFILLSILISMVAAPFILYKDCNHPRKGTSFANLPASLTEKFLSMQINCVILLPLITFLFVIITDTFLALIFPSEFPGFAAGVINLGQIDFIILIILQQAFIFGNVLFTKHKIFKTIMLCVGFYILLKILIPLILTSMLKDQFVVIKGKLISIKLNNIFDLLNFSGNEFGGAIKWLVYSVKIACFSLPAIFLMGTYFKMKKQQYK